MGTEKEEFNLLGSQLQKLISHMESLRIADYMELLENPLRLIMTNFIAGLARGLGIALGATLIFALMLEFLRRIIMLNIPGIGGFIADLVHIVEVQNGRF